VNAPKEKIRVLVVDDHFMARLGLSLPISQEPDMAVVGEAADIAEALDAYRIHQPDVVTMDYRLGNGTGVEATLKIRSEFAKARVLMLSAFEGEEDIFRAMEAGVRGYLTKDSKCHDVLEAIRAVHGGGTVFPPKIEEKLNARGGRTPLNEREIEIVRRIVEGRSNKEIAELMGLGEPLVKFHVRKILEKLDAPDRTRAAIVALERGIIHHDD
jgi:DNA-binding NarL/FixJ family response regulator